MSNDMDEILILNNRLSEIKGVLKGIYSYADNAEHGYVSAEAIKGFLEPYLKNKAEEQEVSK